MTKTEIIYNLKQNMLAFSATCVDMDTLNFFSRQDNKWSPAENAGHLMLSASPLIIAFSLPRFTLRLLFKKPNRQGRSFDDMELRYKKKLEEGYKASSAYIPKQVNTKNDLKYVVTRFNKMYEKLIAKIETWNDADLDNYLLPHPLLGKLTLREMLYFTIFHIEHHHIATKKYLNQLEYKHE